MRAAGGCTIRLNGIDYRAARPRFVDRDQAMQAGRPAFNRVERITFRALGIRQFLLLQRAD